MRTRSSPMLSVRQTASPVSPGCVVAGCLLQSVTVNGRAGIFMGISLCLLARVVACAEAVAVRNAREGGDCGSGDRGAAGDLAVSRELVRRRHSGALALASELWSALALLRISRFHNAQLRIGVRASRAPERPHLQCTRWFAE